MYGHILIPTDGSELAERGVAWVDWRRAMRSILAFSLLIALCGSANTTTVHHARQRHAIVRPNQGMIASDPSGFAYAPPGPRIYYRPAPYNVYNEPYFGASQGYAPGEKERFLQSVRQNL
jgi:hypothetical protein